MEFIPRPYKLFNRIQPYEWGTKNENAFIPKFLGIPAKPDKPYAELWIGAHPKAPSEIEIGGNRIPLNEAMAKYTHEILGEYVSKKFSGTLPFLLKVLSAARALSIQTHPDKSQAVKLHALHPEHYPDDNHKPEVAIALDSLTAFVGFKPADEIVASLRTVPELGEFADVHLFNEVTGRKGHDLETAITELYADVMRRAGDKERLSACIGKIRDRLSVRRDLAPEEVQFLKQYELYGNDVGLLSFFFFNLVDLKPGQAVFTRAGVPHAYIEGNIIECMANSDNVVRAGLTNKFRDVETLLDIMRFEFGRCEIMNPEQKMDEVVYNVDVEEFRVTHFRKGRGNTGVCWSNDRPSVYLIAGGGVNVAWNHAGADLVQDFSKGESFLVPASLSEFRVSSRDEADYFVVEIP